MTRLCIFLTGLLLAATTLAATPVHRGESDGMAFVVERLAEGLGIPWGMAFVGPGQLLFTERAGDLGLLDVASGQVHPVDGGPQVKAEGQGGLLDVAVPPGFQPGDWIYFTYSKNQDGQGVTALARAKLEEDRLASWQDLVITRSATDTSRHYGSRIAFDAQGHLFFTVGDRGERPNGQDLTTHAGSVLRVTLEGKAPQDNPFVDRQALDEIWSYGHRNPQGIAYDHQHQRLWVIEHGPRGGDEINRILPGLNYGWPVVSHGKEYWGPVDVGEATHKPGMEDPIKVYIPSIAPGSLLYYTGKAFPGWQGDLLAGALKLTHLNRVELSEEGQPVAEERLLEELDQRIRALAQDEQGWLYLSTDNGDILRLRPADALQ